MDTLDFQNAREDERERESWENPQLLFLGPIVILLLLQSRSILLSFRALDKI